MTKATAYYRLTLLEYDNLNLKVQRFTVRRFRRRRATTRHHHCRRRVAKTPKMNPEKKQICVFQ